MMRKVERERRWMLRHCTASLHDIPHPASADLLRGEVQSSGFLGGEGDVCCGAAHCVTSLRSVRGQRRYMYFQVIAVVISHC